MGNYAGLVVRGSDGQNDRAGADVAIIGDINGDDIADFAIAQPGGSGYGDRGAVYVVFGDDATDTSEGLPVSLNVDDLDGTNGFEITGDSDLFGSLFEGEVQTYGGFGNSIAALGDINGDGIDDFGITNEATFTGYYGYFNDGSPYDGEGVAYVILGGQTFESSQEVDDLAGFRIDVEGSVENIVGLGDINGDGIGDVAINTVDRDAYGTREIETFYFRDVDGNGVYDRDAANSANYYGEYAYYGSLTQAVGQATSYVVFGTDEARVSDEPIATGGGGLPVIDGPNVALTAFSVPEDAPTAGDTIVDATQLDGSDGFAVQTGTSLTEVYSFNEGNYGGVYLGSSDTIGGITSLGDINGDGINDLVVNQISGGNELFDRYGSFGAGYDQRLLTIVAAPNGDQTITLDVTTTDYYDGSSSTETYADPDTGTYLSSFGSFVIFGNESDAPFPDEIDLTDFPRPDEVEFVTDPVFQDNAIAGVGNAVGNDGFDDVATRGFIFNDLNGDPLSVRIQGTFLLPGSENGGPDAAGVDGTFFDDTELLESGDAALFVDFTAGNVSATSSTLGFSQQGVYALGNVGGDLSDDFAIVALRQDANQLGDPTNPFEAAVYVTFGSVDPLTGVIDLGASFVEGIAAADRPAYRIEGFENNFNLSASGLGDVNGDGFNDLIIGDPNADGSRNQDGEVYVVFGGTDALSAADAADGSEDGIIDIDNLGVDVVTGALPIELSVRGNSTLFRSEGDVGTTLFEFIVDRSGDATQPVSFDFAVTPSGFDGADADDFVGGALPSGTIDFADGADFATITVEVQGDFDQENSEDFTLTISNATTTGISPVSINRDTATARILNDDFPVNLRINNASVAEGDNDADNRELTFTVSRSGEVDVEATVDYEVFFSTATADDFEAGIPTTGTVSFGVGETSAQIVLPIDEDNDIENNEFLSVQLSNATATAPAGAPAGTVVPIVISDASGFGTIITDDFPVQLRINNAFVSEGDVDNDNRELVFSIVRSGDLGPDVEVDVTFSASSFRPADADDFETDPFGTQTVSFTGGDTIQQIRLAIDEDFNIETDERIEARLSNVQSVTGEDIASTIVDSFALGTISNDDFPPRITVGGGGFVSEGPFNVDGGTTPLTFTISRTGDTVGNTTVTFDLNGVPFEGDFFSASDADIASVEIDGVSVTDDTGNLLRPGYEVSFGDGEATKTITVNVLDDAIIEPRESFELRITQVDTDNGTDYEIFTPARTGTILNDDGRPPIIPPGVEADVFGDPHIVTLDGLGYDFQAVGEYVLVETLSGATNPFQVQVRFEPLPGSDLVSTTTRMAVNIGTDFVVEVDAIGEDPFMIIGPDGVRTPTDAEIALGVADVDGNGTGDFFFDLATGEFTVVLNDQNEQLKGKVMDGTMNVCVFLADTDTGNQGNVRGLMGDADGDDADGNRDTTDDLILRAGTEVPVGSGLVDVAGDPVPEGVLAQDVPLQQPVAFETLYGVYADGWRLDGTNGKDRVFSDDLPDFPANFPAALLTVDDLPEQVRLEAEAAVLAAQDPNDPLDQTIFEAAVLDFALTGNPDFITGALGLAAEEEESTEPTGSPEIPVTVSVSVRPDEFTEGDDGTTPVTFTFFRLDDGAAPLSIAYNITGTADADDVAEGTNFSGTVEFAGETSEGADDGQTEANVVIDVLGDLATELDETLTVTITDSGGALIAGATATAVIATDDFAPEAQDDAFSTAADAVVVGNLFADNQPLDPENNADSDADGDTLTVVSATNSDGASIGLNFNRILPSGATLDLNSDGTFTYTAGGFFNTTTIFEELRSNELLSETFTYVISDGNGGFDEATATINVLGVDDAPIAFIDEYDLTEDESVSGNMITDDTVGRSDSDPEGGPLTLTKIGGVLLADLDEDAATDGTQISLGVEGSLGQLTVFANGDFTYDTDGQFEGLGDALPQLVSRLVSVQYTIEDDTGLEDSDFLRFDIEGVNDGPEASDDSAETEFGTAVNIDVLGNDSDVDNAIEDIEVTEASSDEGDVEIEDDGTLTFTPQEGFSGTAIISYTIADLGGETSTAQVTVEVAEVPNAGPVATSDSFETDEDTTVEGNILDNDEDDGIGFVEVARVFDSSGVEIPFDTPTALPEGGLVTISRDGSFGFDPNSDFEARGFNPQPEPPAILLSYISTDGIDESELTPISIDVTGVNDGPVANADTASGDEGTDIVIDVLANDTDAESDLLTVFSFTDGLNGTVALNSDGDLVYTPNDPEFSGVDVFEYVATDGLANSAATSVTVTVNAVNDAPEASDAEFEVVENTTAVGQVVATDVDSPTLTYEIVGGADGDLFEVDENTGELSFISAPDFEANGSAAGNNTYEVIVSASDGDLSDEATLTVQVTDEDEGTGPNIVLGENNTGLEVLTGTDGADIIFSGGGFYDIVTGGADADTFVFGGGAGDGQQNMVITDFEAGVDALDLGGQGVFFDFASAGTTYLYLDGGDFDLITVQGASSIDEIIFVEDTTFAIV